MNPQQRYSRGVFAIIAASVIWGTTGTAASFAPDISALAIGAFAMGVGGVLLVVNALGELTRDRALLLAQCRNVLIGGLSVALYPLVFYSSMRLSGVAIGTVVSIASAPLFTVVLECLVSDNYLEEHRRLPSNLAQDATDWLVALLLHVSVCVIDWLPVEVSSYRDRPIQVFW